VEVCAGLQLETGNWLFVASRRWSRFLSGKEQFATHCADGAIQSAVEATLGHRKQYEVSRKVVVQRANEQQKLVLRPAKRRHGIVTVVSRTKTCAQADTESNPNPIILTLTLLLNSMQ